MLVADEFAAADSYYFFKEPTYHRYPGNTDEIFAEFKFNPNIFEDFEIPVAYLGQRYHDLDNDLNALARKGYDEQTYNKVRYYTGMVAKLRELYFSAEPYGLIAIGHEYALNQNQLDKMRGKVSIPVYYYHKGQTDILRQIVLNTPLVERKG
jgi:hypothetical protein